MCKDDKMLIDNKNEESNEQIKGLNDPMKLKRFTTLLFSLNF